MTDALAEFRLELQPLADGLACGGEQVRGLVYALLEAADPALSAAVHGIEGPKPFTCSGLISETGEQPWTGPVAAGRSYAIRLTALSGDVAEALEGELAQRVDSGEPLLLGRTPFRALGEAQVGRSSYRELAQMPPRAKWAFSFQSPTAFKQRHGQLPLPMPARIIGSAFSRWNGFCPEVCRMEEDVLEAVEESVFPSRLRIETRLVRLKRGAFVGFTGDVELGSVKPLSPETAARITALAHYVHFSGVGHGVSWGFGQTTVCRR